MRSYLDRIPVAGAKARVIAKKPAEGVVIREFDLSQLPAVFRRLPIVGQFSWSLSLGGHPSASLEIIATYQTIAIVRHLFVRDRALTLFGIGFKINSYNESQGNYGLAPGGVYFCSISLGGKWEDELEEDRFLDEGDDAQEKFSGNYSADVQDAARQIIDNTRNQVAIEIGDRVSDMMDIRDFVDTTILVRPPDILPDKRLQPKDLCYQNRADLGDPDALNPNNWWATGVSRSGGLIDPQCAVYIDKNETGYFNPPSPDPPTPPNYPPGIPPINNPDSPPFNPPVNNSPRPQRLPPSNSANPRPLPATNYRNPNYDYRSVSPQYSRNGNRTTSITPVKLPSNRPPSVPAGGASFNLPVIDSRQPNAASTPAPSKIRASSPPPPTVQSLGERGGISVPIVKSPPLLMPPRVTGMRASQPQLTASTGDQPPGKTTVKLSQGFNSENLALHGQIPDYTNPEGLRAVSINNGRTWVFQPSQLFPLSNNKGISIYCETSYNDKNKLLGFPADSAALPDFNTLLPDFETPSPIFPEIPEGKIGYTSKYNNFQIDFSRPDAKANEDTLKRNGYDPSELPANLDIEERPTGRGTDYFKIQPFDPTVYVNPSDAAIIDAILNDPPQNKHQWKNSPSYTGKRKYPPPPPLKRATPRFVRQPMVRRTIKEGSPNPSSPPGNGLLRDTGLNWDSGGLTKSYSERTTVNGLPIQTINETWGFAYTGGQIVAGSRTNDQGQSVPIMAGSPGALWGRVKREVTEFHYDPSTGYALGSTTRGFQSVRFQQENPNEPETIALKKSTDPKDAKKMALYEPKLVPILAQQRNKIYTYNAYYQDAQNEMPPYEIFKLCNRDGTADWGYVMQPDFVPSAFVSQESFLRRCYSRAENPDFDPKEGGKPQYFAAGEETWNQVRHVVSPAASNASQPPDNASGLGMEIEWKLALPTEDTYTTFSSRQSNGGPNFTASAFDESFTESIGRPSPATRLAASYKLEKPDNTPIQNDYEEDEERGAIYTPPAKPPFNPPCWISPSDTNPPTLRPHPPDRTPDTPPRPRPDFPTRPNENRPRPDGSYNPLFPPRQVEVTTIPDKLPVPPKMKAIKDYEYYICTPGHTFKEPVGGSLSFPTAISLAQAIMGAATQLKINDIQSTLSTRIRVPFNSVIRPLDKVRFRLGGTSYRRIVRGVSNTIEFKGLVDGKLKVEWQPTDLDLGIDRTIPIFSNTKEIISYEPEDVFDDSIIPDDPNAPDELQPLDSLPGYEDPAELDPDNPTDPYPDSPAPEDLPPSGGYGATGKETGKPNEPALQMVYITQVIRGLGEDVDFSTNRIF